MATLEGRWGRLAAAAAVVAGLIVTISPAEAVGVTVGTTPVPGSAQASFQFNVSPAICDSDTQVTVDGVADAVVTLTDPNNGTITLPTSKPGGFYSYTVDCDAGEGRVQAPGNLAFFRVIVTKVVTGAPAPGTQFPVSVACTATNTAGNLDEATPSTMVPPLNAAVTFDSAGGTKYLFAYTAQTCTVTENDDGGAQRSSITTQDCGTLQAPPVEAAPQAAGPSGNFALYSPADCTQTITNGFPAPAATAAAPGVVAARPTFTG